MMDSDQVCGCPITLYSKGEGHAEITSNAYKHFRHKADKGCQVCISLLTPIDRLRLIVIVLPPAALQRAHPVRD